jgi:hypothetical protein
VIPLTRALARRRHALVARSREQRAELMFAALPSVRGLALVDRAAAFVRARPFVVTLGAAAMVALGPRKLLTWGLRVAPLAALLRRL